MLMQKSRILLVVVEHDNTDALRIPGSSEFKFKLDHGNQPTVPFGDALPLILFGTDFCG